MTTQEEPAAAPAGPTRFHIRNPTRGWVVSDPGYREIAPDGGRSSTYRKRQAGAEVVGGIGLRHLTCIVDYDKDVVVAGRQPSE